MKNIFLFPTENSSRLSYDQDGVLQLNRLQWRKRTQYVYITSDEKFKINEWITDGIEIIKATPKLVNAQGLVDRRDWKKIVLTTDQDLIEDYGVQSIDDDFLEWFVKNPTCEYVKVKKITYPSTKGFLEGKPLIIKNIYEIIIPKEEPKFEDSTENSLNIISIANSMFGKKEEPKQTDWVFEISSGYNGYRNKITSDWIYESEYLKIFNGSKQETPNELDSVLAKITHQNDLGLSQWYEVVYYADDKWCSYSGSKTFEDGERVIEWTYCKDCL